MSRPTRATLQVGQTVYVLVNALFTSSALHEVQALPIDSEAERERVGRHMGPRGVYSYERGPLETIAERLNARMRRNRRHPLVGAIPTRESLRMRVSGASVYA